MITQGKWEVSDGAVLSENINAYGNWIICSCDRERTQEDEDNLHLIAAAPELLAACKLAQEKIYQRCEGSCPYCGEQDYPVKGDKKGYDEVLPEDAEEYHLDHAEDCIVTKIDIAIAKAKKE